MADGDRWEYLEFVKAHWNVTAGIVAGGTGEAVCILGSPNLPDRDLWQDIYAATRAYLNDGDGPLEVASELSEFLRTSCGRAIGLCVEEPAGGPGNAVNEMHGKRSLRGGVGRPTGIVKW
jgi:hypothetical protein